MSEHDTPKPTTDGGSPRCTRCGKAPRDPDRATCGPCRGWVRKYMARRRALARGVVLPRHCSLGGCASVEYAFELCRPHYDEERERPPAYRLSR